MSTLLFFAGYLSVLTLPGLALTLCLKLRFNPVVSTIALSYISFTLLFISANYFDLAHQVLLIALAILLISSVASLAVYRTRLLTELRGFLSPICTITLVSLVYQLLIGAYTEVPADLYAHLERFQIALSQVKQDSLGNSLAIKQLLMQGSSVYYYLLATVASQTQTTAVEIMNAVDFTNRTLFLIAIYFSARFIFSENKNSALIAVLTCVFVILHMGINVFAYIRYYSLAPGMLNLVIYLFAISAFLWVIRKRAIIDLLLAYLLILLAAIAAAAIHLQEAMFIATILALVALIGLSSHIRMCAGWIFDILHNGSRTTRTQCTLAALGVRRGGWRSTSAEHSKPQKGIHSSINIVGRVGLPTVFLEHKQVSAKYVCISRHGACADFHLYESDFR